MATLSIPTLTLLSMICLGLAAVILLASVVVLYRARQNFKWAKKDLAEAQTMKEIWAAERYRFQQPTVILPEDYYRGYDTLEEGGHA